MCNITMVPKGNKNAPLKTHFEKGKLLSSVEELEVLEQITKKTKTKQKPQCVIGFTLQYFHKTVKVCPEQITIVKQGSTVFGMDSMVIIFLKDCDLHIVSFLTLINFVAKHMKG